MRRPPQAALLHIYFNTHPYVQECNGDATVVTNRHPQLHRNLQRDRRQGLRYENTFQQEFALQTFFSALVKASKAFCFTPDNRFRHFYEALHEECCKLCTPNQGAWKGRNVHCFNPQVAGFSSTSFRFAKNGLRSPTETDVLDDGQLV